MEKMAPVGHLELVKLDAELDVTNGFPLFLLELGYPLGLVAMDCDVQFLEHAEVRAWR